MIIFGMRGVNSTMENGEFNCPQCEDFTLYKHKKVTRFFTLYFIPLIPLGRLGEFVECQQCKGTFVPEVLDYQEEAGLSSDGQQAGNQQNDFLSEFDKALKHVLALMILADGEVDDREMEVVLEIINKHGHKDLDHYQLKDYVKKVRRNPENVATYLKGVSPQLNNHGKEMVIQCAIEVAQADDVIDDAEVLLLYEMAEAMELTPKHIRGILREAGIESFTKGGK